jgi:hypothetical protein
LALVESNRPTVSRPLWEAVLDSLPADAGRQDVEEAADDLDKIIRQIRDAVLASADRPCALNSASPGDNRKADGSSGTARGQVAGNKHVPAADPGRPSSAASSRPAMAGVSF